jgi:hypothetical protein
VQLPPDQVERFFAIWFPLLLFVNRKRRLVRDMLRADFAGPWDVAKALKLRNALWAEDSLREAFIAENPAGLAEADLALVASWRHRRAGKFFVLRHLKKHSLFIEDSTVYAVLGLASRLDEVVPFTPCYVQAVLLPFEGRIVYDSLIQPYNIVIGRGIEGSLNQTYKDAKERGAIVTALGPPTESATPEEQREEARAVNARVLEEFRKHVFRSGLSPRVVERDVAHVGAFAEEYLAGLPEPRSLRDFGMAEVRGYLARLSPAGVKADASGRERLTSLKRFLRFVRDTGRMHYPDAEAILKLLRRPRQPE